jgi:hypothetical protein
VTKNKSNLILQQQTFFSFGNEKEKLKHPAGLLVDDVGNILVADNGRGSLCIFRECGVDSRVSDPDPDPDWIRIQSDHWIRIRNLNTDPDPDPGGQKLPTKVEKIHVLKCWMAVFFSCYFFSNFGH